MTTAKRAENRPWFIFISLVGLVTIGGFFLLYPQKLFKPGERLFDLGYNLGLAGGIMMLFLLLYPLRKRFRIFSKFGSLKIWFKMHMVFGILGPLTILFHSTYHVYIPYIHPTGSPNAAVAMLCMLLVSSSGTFGRFFYTKIHQGLYGRQTTVKELYARLEQSDDVNSVFGFAPNVEKALKDFHARTVSQASLSGVRFANFISVGFQARVLSMRLSWEVNRILRAQRARNKPGEAERANLERLKADYQEKISSYLNAVRDASQFQTYEKLFSWWHIFHIPLVYMMVFSAIYHVYAVHAY
jgi:hypothetical protein